MDTPNDTLRVLLDISDRPLDARYGPMLAAMVADPKIQSDPNLNHAVIIASVSHAGPVLAALAPMKIPAESLKVVELIARNASGTDFSELMVTMNDSKLPAVTDAIIRGLSAGAKPSKPLSPNAEKAVGKLLVSLPMASRGRLLKLANGLGIRGLDAQLVELLKGLYTSLADEDASDTSRLEAAKQLIELSREYAGSIRGLGFQQADLEKRKKAHEAASKGLADVLDAGQAKRLKQLELQQRGAGVFNDPQIAKQLEITAVQRGVILTALQGFQPKWLAILRVERNTLHELLQRKRRARERRDVDVATHAIELPVPRREVE